MDIIINTNESNASLWLSIISLIIAIMAFIVPIIREHSQSKKKFWNDLNSKFKLSDYNSLIDNFANFKIDSVEYYNFQQMFYLFQFSSQINGFFINKIENQLELIKNTNSILHEKLNKYWKQNEMRSWVYKNKNDENNNNYEEELLNIVKENGKNYKRLKILLTSPPYNW